jgi:hypothetical protein
MTKCQSTGIKNRKKQGNINPQKVNNHTMKNLKDNEGDEISVSELKIILIIIIINEIKKDMQK